MIDARILLRIPIPFQNICTICTPTAAEVIGNPSYNAYKTCLTMSQEEIEDVIRGKDGNGVIPETGIPTPFQNLFESSEHNSDYHHLVQEAFMFFIKEPVTLLFDQKRIVIGDIEEIIKNMTNIEDLKKLKFITEDNFFDFQNLVRLACGDNPVEPPNPNEPERIKKMKAKARYRDKIKAKQQARDGITIGTNLAAICCMGIGLNPLNIGEISYPSISWLTTFYQNKEKYDTDIRSLQAGAKKKDVNPKYWIANLD